ncbi:MAG: hypothetical protein JSW60_06995 [Thermoplasmatales archaeon]|nr:MAG: hypothetical protein JSW60_06995 [Thermoplasmatales archaeon]
MKTETKYKIPKSIEWLDDKSQEIVNEFYDSFEQSRNIFYLIEGKDLRDKYV